MLREGHTTKSAPIVPAPAGSVRRFGGYLSHHIFLLPVLVVFVLLYAIPFGQSLYLSFTDSSAANRDPRFVGFENYSRIFNDSAMTSALFFTVLFTVATTVAITAIAIPLAVVLNTRLIGRNFVRSAFFFPAIPSIAVLGLVWGLILSPLGSGVLNSVLRTLLGVEAIPWLAESNLARFSVIMVGVWQSTGWHTLLYLAYLQSIPSDFYEAARVDGASRTRQFFSLTLPLLAPAMTVSWLLLLTGGLRVYELPFTLSGGGPGFATYTITQSILNRGVAEAEYGQASALALIFLLLSGAVVAAQMYYSRRLEGRTS